jgi:YebC/PmpR family DNA-binding regulatory protein
MSGHSHYATIKRAKEAKDSQRGKIFSKMAREIAIAVREGRGTDPNFNYKLRMILDKARSFNMPKSNIERAINSGTSGEALKEVIYEGFGPSGVAVMVVAATDNHNRTGQEIKNLFERAGGNLGGPGSVSFNFDNKGLILIQKAADSQKQMLQLIDLGVEDVEETEDAIEVYVAPDRLNEVRNKLEGANFNIISSELCLKPKNFVTISDPKDSEKILSFLDSLEEHDDVQRVYANVDILTK